MEERFAKELANVTITPLSKELAATLRAICTHLGLATRCPSKKCRRARACATHDVLCWQIMQEKINPMIMRAAALNWQRRVAKGENPDVSPSRVTTYQNILARLKEEEAGGAGDDGGKYDSLAGDKKDEDGRRP